MNSSGFWARPAGLRSKAGFVQNSRAAQFSVPARHFDGVFAIWALKAGISSALIERLLCQGLDSIGYDRRFD